MTTVVDLVPDNPGRVKKEILRSGDGEVPPPGSRVHVHYAGRLTDGSEFDSSYKRNKPLEFVAGLGQVVAGWDHCVLSMRKGERCRLTLAPEYAYGDHTVGPIPARSTLVFDMELVDWGPGGETAKGLCLKIAVALAAVALAMYHMKPETPR